MTDSTNEPPANQKAVTVRQALKLASKHHQAGRLPEAENIYRTILKKNPDHPVALHLLGLIAHQFNKNEDAAKLIKKAIEIAPEFTNAHSNLGNILRLMGHFEDAEKAAAGPSNSSQICRKRITISRRR